MEQRSCEVSRRDLLRAGTAITVAAAGLPAFAAEAKDGAKPALPTRVLGKRTGQKVSIISQGTTMKMDNRLLNTGWAEGVRYIDTAAAYQKGQSERVIAEWFERTGKRKEIFLVTKNAPGRRPERLEAMIDERLAALKTDYIDLFFLHGLRDVHLGFPNSKEWAAAAEKVKKSGKVKFVGFSTHAPMDDRIELMNQAADGWADAIMVAQNPSLIRDNKNFNRALDKCHKAGIGLISMKEMRGLDGIPEVVPEFDEMGLSKHAAVLSAVWTDERFSSICSAMNNVRIVRENTSSARDFKPLPDDKITMITDIVDRHNQVFCHGCTKKCCKAAGKEVAFSDIARYLNYYEADGQRDAARELFRALPIELRDWRGADLRAASEACASKLPLEEIMQRAEEKLA